MMVLVQLLRFSSLCVRELILDFGLLGTLSQRSGGVARGYTLASPGGVFLNETSLHPMWLTAYSLQLGSWPVATCFEFDVQL